MADPEKAFNFTMDREDPHRTGVIVSEPRGGRARFGINSMAHPEAVRACFYDKPIAAALEYAETIYKYDYFNQVGGYIIRDQNVCNKYADLAFNAGVHQATLFVQRAVNWLRTQSHPMATYPHLLKEDGEPGHITLTAINETEPTALLAAIKVQAKAFYKRLAMSDPKLAAQRDGWMNRVNA